MGKGAKKQTVTTAPDAASQQYINRIRGMAGNFANQTLQGGPMFTGPQTMSVGEQVGQFMNPYMSNVIDATRGEFDNLRGDALNRTRQEATLGGGFGGSRMAVLAGSRLGQLDRGQASTIGGLLSGGYQNAMSQAIPYFEQQRMLRQQQMQEPLFRNQQALQMMNLGMGPTGQTQTTTMPGNSLLGTIGGLATTGIGLASGLGWSPFGGGG